MLLSLRRNVETNLKTDLSTFLPGNRVFSAISVDRFVRTREEDQIFSNAKFEISVLKIPFKICETICHLD